MKMFAILVRKFGIFVLVGVFLVGFPYPGNAADYRIQKISESIYAAIAVANSRATSNAVIFVTDREVILAGAHFSPEGIREILNAIEKITPLQLRYIILTHHHRGYNYLDFDLPSQAEVITTWQTWQALKGEYRQLKNPLLFFDKGLTMQRGNMTIVLSNVEYGHTEGDIVVFVPVSGLLFTSDLVFNDSVGFMGDGHMRDWVAGLRVLEEMGAKVVVPGVGNVTDGEGIRRFRLFMQDFFTELLTHLEKGESLSDTKKKFTLPEYEELPGYNTFFSVNIERAYKELKKSQ
jgi:glyoxylase-like metal-dependent hydrolase (beta-lactamase superfamily II)